MRAREIDEIHKAFDTAPKAAQSKPVAKVVASKLPKIAVAKPKPKPKMKKKRKGFGFSW
jgi:hypothetical protein